MILRREVTVRAWSYWIDAAIIVVVVGFIVLACKQEHEIRGLHAGANRDNTPGAGLGHLGANRDAIVPISLTATWTRHTIVAGDVALSRNGSDGLDLADVDGDGDLDITSPWEQGNKATESLNPGPAGAKSLWTTTTIPGGATTAGTAPEAAVYCDIDNDGAIDVIIGEDGNQARILFAPLLTEDRTDGTNWTRVNIDASFGFRWIAVACVDIDNDGVTDLVMGGGEDSNSPSSVSIFESSDPRTSSSWTQTNLGANARVMWLEVLDLDGDGDLDIFVSDRLPITVPSSDTTRQGLAWYESDGLNPPSFTYNQIVNEPHHRMVSLRDWDGDGDLDIIDCRSNPPNVEELNLWINDGAFVSFTKIALTPPTATGSCQHVDATDIDRDGVRDLAVSYFGVGDQESGVVWLKNAGSHAVPVFDRGEAYGLTGTTVGGRKFDNIYLLDVDGDKDLDIVASEQNFDLDNNETTGPGDGVVWLENPQ